MTIEEKYKILLKAKVIHADKVLWTKMRPGLLEDLYEKHQELLGDL